MSGHKRSNSSASDEPDAKRPKSEMTCYLAYILIDKTGEELDYGVELCEPPLRKDEIDEDERVRGERVREDLMLGSLVGFIPGTKRPEFPRNPADYPRKALEILRDYHEAGISTKDFCHDMMSSKDPNGIFMRVEYIGVEKSPL